MKIFIFITLVSLSPFAIALQQTNDGHFMDSENYDPMDPQIEDLLQQYDSYYEAITGQPAWLLPTEERSSCYRETCDVWAVVNKSQQKMKLYVDGTLVGTYLVSTGAAGHSTPDFDRHPDGRIYDAYSSTKYPGGDYNGLGNMPYAVFIKGGFAIHGTPQGNWDKLGQKASHGCIRLHPDNAKKFNQLVRERGISATWITVQ